jgi:hypothetical protein
MRVSVTDSTLQLLCCFSSCYFILHIIYIILLLDLSLFLEDRKSVHRGNATDRLTAFFFPDFFVELCLQIEMSLQTFGVTNLPYAFIYGAQVAELVV